MEQVAEGTSSSLGPSWMLWAAVAAVLLGLAALWGGVFAHFAGYVLASLLAFTLVALFRRASLERQARSGIVAPHWMNLVAAVTLAAGFGVAVGQAYLIATHFS